MWAGVEGPREHRQQPSHASRDCRINLLTRSGSYRRDVPTFSFCDQYCCSCFLCFLTVKITVLGPHLVFLTLHDSLSERTKLLGLLKLLNLIKSLTY